MVAFLSLHVIKYVPVLSKKAILTKYKIVGFDTGEAEWNLMTYEL